MLTVTLLTIIRHGEFAGESECTRAKLSFHASERRPASSSPSWGDSRATAVLIRFCKRKRKEARRSDRRAFLLRAGGGQFGNSGAKEE
jgi:hypothetical protein